MAESQSNVTIRLRVPMGDMSGLKAGSQETAAWTRELSGLDRQLRSTFGTIQDYRTKQRQQGFLSDADQQRLHQAESRTMAQRGREAVLRTETGGALGAMGELRNLRQAAWQTRAAGAVTSPLDPGLVHMQRLSAWQARMIGQPQPPTPPSMRTTPAQPGGPGTPPPAGGGPPPPIPPRQTRGAAFPPPPPPTPPGGGPPGGGPPGGGPPTPPGGAPTPPPPVPSRRPRRPSLRPPRAPQGTAGGMRSFLGYGAQALGYRAAGLFGGGQMMHLGGQVGSYIGTRAGSSIGRGMLGMMGMVTGGVGGTGVGGPGGAFIGSMLGTMAGMAGGLMIDRLIDRATASLERYEQRVTHVAETSAQLIVPYEDVNANIDEMRTKYHYLAADSLQAWQGIAQHRGGNLTPAVERALRFGRAFGISPAQAADMQGRMERNVAPGMTLTDLAWAQYARPFRPGVPEIGPVQFAQQALGIAEAGGLDTPAMGGSYAGRMTQFLGGMGQKFPGQQAQAFQQLNAAASTPTDPMFEMMRHRAITRLAERLPGGKITIGEGADAEEIDLRTLRGRRKAMQLAGQSGTIMEEYARVGEEYGRGVPGLAEDFAHEVLAPTMSVFRADRLLRERRELGPEGLRELDRRLPGGKGREVEEDLMKALPDNFKELLRINAAMEKAFEPMASSLFAIKNFLEGRVAGLMEGGNTIAKEGIEAIKAIIGMSNAGLAQIANVLQNMYGLMAPPGMSGPWQPPTPAQIAAPQPPGPWLPPTPDPQLGPMRSL